MSCGLPQPAAVSLEVQSQTTAPFPSPLQNQTAQQTLADGAKKVLGHLLPNDSAFVRLALHRAAEQDKWNGIFSSKLIELLDSIDDLKSEIRRRMEIVESAAKAEALLVDEMAKVADLTSALADIEHSWNAMKIDLEAAIRHYRDARRLRITSGEALQDAYGRLTECKKLLGESTSRYDEAAEVALSGKVAYEQSKVNLEAASSEYRAASYLLSQKIAAVESASERLRAAEHVQIQAAGLARNADLKASSALVDLEHAKTETNDAKRESKSARDAYILAHKKLQLILRWVIVAGAFSWTAAGWMAWWATRERLMFTIAAAETFMLALLFVYLIVEMSLKARRGQRDS